MDALTHQPIPAGQTPQPYSCGGATVPNNDWWNTNGGGSVEPGLTETPALTGPDIWYSYRDNNTATPLGTPCFTLYGPNALTAPVAPGSTTSCPRLFPELFTGGVGPHGAAKYHFDPANPKHDEVPAVLRRLGDPGRVHAGHAARGQARLAEPHLQDQRVPGLWRGERHAGAVHVRVRQPDGHAVGQGRLVLPADLRRRVLQHQRRRRHVPLGLRQGPARAEGRADHRQDRRPHAADGQVHQGSASSDADPGDSITLLVGLRRRHGAVDRGRSDAHLHEGRPLSRPS